MFQKRNVITAVEIGTTKICVLIGESDKDGGLTVLGHGEAPSGGSVVKGEIVEMNTAVGILSKVFDEANKSAGCEIDRDNIYIAVTGADINYYQGIGTVIINNEDSKVSEEDVNQAVQNARVKPIPPDKMIINSFDSYYLLDGTRRLRTPVDQIASRLEACIHVVYGDRNRVKNFQNALRDIGFEDGEGHLVFSAVASAYALISDHEQENGALLVEMGGGITEYIMVHNHGPLSSGVIPVGLDHLANDISIGLDLHISQARKMIKENHLHDLRRQGKSFFEITSASSGAVRKISLNSLEKIIDLRLRETFTMIRKELKKENALNYLSCGGILSGGAALFPPALEIYESVFEFPVRQGIPEEEVSGALTDLESPRYSTVLGLLKYGSLATYNGERGKGSIFDKLMRGVDNMSSPIMKGFSSLRNSIKF
ncbi:MAG: cell division protein FtsA [Lentisphaerae bacterium GWF2_45_14]|nr:MAG: cell division protein FtsA [Lentisphaerae bacterium GWF2_45_14]